MKIGIGSSANTPIEVAGTVTSDEANGLLRELINKLLSDYNTQSGAYFESVRVEDGQGKVEGDVPSSLRRQPKS